jgi:hypothetical protein
MILTAHRWHLCVNQLRQHIDHDDPFSGQPYANGAATRAVAGRHPKTLWTFPSISNLWQGSFNGMQQIRSALQAPALVNQVSTPFAGICINESCIGYTALQLWLICMSVHRGRGVRGAQRP